MSQEIYKKIVGGDISSLSEFLQSFDDINQCDDEYYFPLHFAASRGLLSCAEVLIENGADVNFNYRETALFAAVKGKFYDVVDFLISKDADTTALNERVFFYF